MSNILSKLKDAVLAKVNSIRKISRKIELPTIEVILKYLDAINALGEFDEILGDMPIDKIKIPSKLAPFIWPKSVRIDTADRGDVDLMVRHDMPKDVPKYTEFIEACDVVAAAMKTSISSYQTVDEIRKNIGFVSVYRNSVNRDNRVVYDGSNPYYPIPLKFDAVENRARNFSYDEMMADFIQWKLPEIFK